LEGSPATTRKIVRSGLLFLVLDTKGRAIRAVKYQCISGKHGSVFAEE
jgi:hypothetical protein